MTSEEWSLKGKERLLKAYNNKKEWVYQKNDIENLHRELQKDKQELQDKILARIAGLLSPPLPPEYTNPENTSQLRLDISAIINEEFRKFGDKMNERFGKE